MADEPDALEQGGDGVDAPVIDTDTPNDQPDPIADLASEMGWVPQEQFRGNPDEWKPAADFIKAGRDINRSMSRELKGMRDQVERIGRTTSQLIEDKVAERDAYWQGQHAKAVETGNLELAERAIDERLKLKGQPSPAGEPPRDPPETADFKSRNAEWFGKDRLATARAMEIAENLAKLGDDIPTQLREVERAIRKEFPEHFKAAAKPPAQTQTGGTRAAATTSRAKGFADMPPESQKLAKEYETKHGIKPETFAASYWADQAKRKVG